MRGKGVDVLMEADSSSGGRVQLVESEEEKVKMVGNIYC